VSITGYISSPQYDCTNTLNDQVLEDVTVEMEVSEGEYEILKTIACPSLPYNTPGTTYVLVKIPDDQSEGMII
jgi:coatomer protein complex subunit gamma